MKKLIRLWAMLPLLLSIPGCKSEESTRDEAPVEQQDAGNYIVTKLDQIVIPKVDFEDTTVEEAIDFIRMRSVELDPETDPTRRGISFHITSARAGVDSDGEPPPDGGLGLGLGDDPSAHRLTFSAKNMKFLDLLAEIAERAKLDVYLTSHGIVMGPEGVDPTFRCEHEVEVWRVIRKAGETSRAADKANKPLTIMTEGHWIPDGNLKHCLSIAASEVGVGFDEDDWTAVQQGLSNTSDTGGCWFSYTLANDDRKLDFECALDDGDTSTGIIHIRFIDLPDPLIAAMLSTVLNICADCAFSSPARFVEPRANKSE